MNTMALQSAVTDLSAELEKAEKGNYAAGTRVRKLCQDIKAETKKIRAYILELRKKS